VTLRIAIVSGIGSGPTRIAAFDQALISAGIANYNLVLLSSVLPPGSIIERRPFIAPAAEYGHRLFVVLARHDTRIHGEVVLQGGTHNPRAPTVEFVQDAYLPLLVRLGFKAEIALEHHGFYPRGGGRIRASIEPFRRAGRFELCERGPVQSRTARALLVGLPPHIGQREIGVLRAST